MTRILFIKPNYKQSGQIWAINQFYKEIKSFNYKSFLLTGGKIYSKDKNIFYGYDTETIKKPLYGTFYSIKTLVKTINLTKPDIIHINNHIGALTCILVSKIFCPNCFISLDIRTPPPSKIKTIYYKIISKLVDNIFALNEDILKEYGSNTSKRVLPLGYDENIFFPRKPKKSNQTKNFIYYGSLDKVRRLHNMLYAFENLDKTGYDFKLIIIGSGNAKNDLIAQVKKVGLNKKVIFIDQFLSQRKLANYISKSDIGISYIPIIDIFNPNLPLKTVELLACGIPVCATATKGNQSIINHKENGLLSGDSVKDYTKILKESFLINFNTSNERLKNLTWNMIVKEHLVKFYNHR